MSKTVEKPTAIHLERTFAAPIERVWAAWTQPDAVRHWLGCAESRVVDCRIDLRVGGEFYVKMKVAEQDTALRCQYTEIEPPGRLAFSWQWEGEPEVTNVVVELKTVDGGTAVTLRHEGFAIEDISAGHREGWILSLGRIAEQIKAA